MAAELVPGYRIVHMIGQGGQAQVYLAERETDGLRVALKVLDSKLRHDRVFFERFLREYKLLTALENEFVVRIYDQRSEEHTSELQSRLHLVCRLLLEKKKSQS